MACIFLINYLRQLVIYQKAYTKKICQPLNNFKELSNFQFGKELTLKALKNIYIEEASDFFMNVLQSVHQSMNSFRILLYTESENILATNRLIAISRQRENRRTSFEFTKRWFQSKILWSIKSDNGFYKH